MSDLQTGTGLLVAIGAAVGAPLRFVLGSRIDGAWPRGTFVVNVTGCFAMGLAMVLLTDRLVANPGWRYLIPIGFIGAYTTFSTFEFETFRAVTEGGWLIGAANVVGSVVAGYAALWIGVVMGGAL